MDDQKYTFGKTFEKDYWVNEDGTYKGDSYTRGTYTPEQGGTVDLAYQALQAQMAQKPAGYQSQWQTQLNDTINKITNRDKFSYDVNGDALYQQYKDKYIQQGKLAMQDTMGQAAAMTGGYGNSYAATAGNQAYQAHLNNLNDVVPELYQMAYNRYQDEGQELYNQYSLFADRDNTDYGRYRDTVSDWQTDRSFLANHYYNERDFDYGKFSDEETANQAQWNADRTFAYGQYSDDLTLDYEESKRLHDEKLAADAAANSNDNTGNSNKGLTPSEWNAIHENAAIYAESGKSSLANYVNGLVNRGWLDPDEAADILEQYFPTGYLPTNPKKSEKEYRVGNQTYMVN